MERGWSGFVEISGYMDNPGASQPPARREIVPFGDASAVIMSSGPACVRVHVGMPEDAAPPLAERGVTPSGGRGEPVETMAADGPGPGGDAVYES